LGTGLNFSGNRNSSFRAIFDQFFKQAPWLKEKFLRRERAKAPFPKDSVHPDFSIKSGKSATQGICQKISTWHFRAEGFVKKFLRQRSLL